MIDGPVTDAELLQEIIAAAVSTNEFTTSIRVVGNIFSRADLLNRSFLSSPDAVATEQDPACDPEELADLFATIDSTGHEGMRNSLANALRTLAASAEYQSAYLTDPQALRQYFIVLQCERVLSDPENHTHVVLPLLRALRSLPGPAERTLVNWFATLPAACMARAVGALQQFVTVRLYMTRAVGELVPAVQVLGLLYAANRRSRALPYHAFYNDAVNEEVNVKEDFLRWKRREGTGQFAFLQHPHVLSAASKADALRIDATIQMQQEFRSSIMSSLFSGAHEASPYLVLEVRRSEIIPDTLQRVSSLSGSTFKRPLKVKFVGEEGVDAGGVAKEFFQVITRALFDPSYGMFLYNPSLRTFWLNGNSLEASIEFELIGIIIGLAIYNGVLLEMNFPMVLYRKLLGHRPTLDDLAEVDPEVAKSLRQLLQLDAASGADLDLTFEVTYDAWGAHKTHELKPGGSDIAVTPENREEYVALYVQWRLEAQVERQFAAFARGFYRVVERGLLQHLFCAEELELLVCGSPSLDFEALERNAKYDGYSSDDPVVRNFWTVVHAMTPEQQKQLLAFATGSDRAPINGLGDLKFVIARNGSDASQLPTSHTCFNVLMLPTYPDLPTLRDRLLRAIEESEGFGLL